MGLEHSRLVEGTVPGVSTGRIAAIPLDIGEIIGIARHAADGTEALYACAGVPEYWILNLTDRRLDVYQDPQGSAYRTHVTYASDDKVTPLAAPACELRVESLLP